MGFDGLLAQTRGETRRLMTDPYGEAINPEVPAELPRPPGMPRWVKVSLLVVGVLALVLIGTALLGSGGGGGHGPGMHGALPEVASPSSASLRSEP
jgi:hypothetical protein